MPNNPYIFYSQPEDGRRITIAAIKGEDQYLFGMSICAPCDQFVKKIGRNIAIGRAQCGQTIFTKSIESTPMKAGEFIEIANGICTELFGL